MNEQSSQSPEDGLLRGDRIPDLSLPTGDGRTLLLYEFANGSPLMLAACATDWAEADRSRFANAVHALAERRGFQSVVLDGAPDAAGSYDNAPTTSGVTALDEAGRVRRRLFGALVSATNGAVVVADPNLRVVDGAVVEAPALRKGAAFTSATEALLDEVLEALRHEASTTPGAAPVLIVPRALPLELCQELVAGFGRWGATESPMPVRTGTGLAVDRDRKARLDAPIGDASLEQELVACIARRVLPEVSKAFQFRATRFERPKLVCYRALEAGHFAAHRDNTAPATAHRRFALTVNLNEGNYDGGALEFPEYGQDCAYRIGAGTAIVFSCSHAHRVAPVTRGERYAVVSFMFDDGGPARADRTADP